MWVLEFWTNVLPVILSIGFVLSSEGSGVPPPTQEATASCPCAWLLTLPCIIFNLLLCWVHLESSLSILIVCSSVIAQCPSIIRVYYTLGSMYSFPFLVLWVVTTWRLLFSFGLLRQWVRVHLFSIFPILSLFIFGFSVVYIGISCGFVLDFYDY